MNKYYELLEIPIGSSQAEIKTAFKKMAMKYHPDRNPGDKNAEEKFKDINEAYQNLIDKSQQPISNNSYHDTILKHIYDVLNESINNHQRQRNQNIRVNINLTIFEAIFGCSKILKITYATGTKDVTIDIPKGIQNGMTIIYQGLGDNFNKQVTPGELHVIINISQQDNFTIQGSELHTSVKISLWEAIVGTEREIITPLSDKISLKIPENTFANSYITKPNIGGWDTIRNCRGVLRIRIDVELPTITPEQKLIIKDWIENK